MLAVLVILAVLLKVFVIANYTVSGTSMEPTLSEGDWVWVNKVAEPKRGDIVVAYEPSSGKALVKRVVAIEGDTVSLEWKDTGYVVVVQTKEGEKLYENYEGVELPEIFSYRVGILEEPFLVSGGYFLMGDNRNDSNDSRNPDIGVFEYEDFIGVVIGR